MIDNRLWRPAAQRSVRNAWGYIQGQQSAWSAASINARSAATNLVIAYLSHSDVGALDLGVLADMEGIRDKARKKFRALQEKSYAEYTDSYEALVNAVFEMRNIASSMKTYVKDSGGGRLVEFTKNPMVSGDEGDGGGVPVFASLPLSIFEVLAKEIVAMFQKELRVKWLLAVEFHNLVYRSTEAASLKGKHLHFDFVDPLPYIRETKKEKVDEPVEAGSVVLERQSKPVPSREILTVYLTALLAEVYINRDRIAEVSRLWSEEMTGGIAGSPQR